MYLALNPAKIMYQWIVNDLKRGISHMTRNLVPSDGLAFSPALGRWTICSGNSNVWCKIREIVNLEPVVATYLLRHYTRVGFLFRRSRKGSGSDDIKDFAI